MFTSNIIFLLGLWEIILVRSTQPPKHTQKPISSLFVKFQLHSALPFDKFGWGVLLLLLLVLVTGVKQRLSLEFDRNIRIYQPSDEGVTHSRLQRLKNSNCSRGTPKWRMGS